MERSQPHRWTSNYNIKYAKHNIVDFSLKITLHDAIGNKLKTFNASNEGWP